MLDQFFQSVKLAIKNLENGNCFSFNDESLIKKEIASIWQEAGELVNEFKNNPNDPKTRKKIIEATCIYEAIASEENNLIKTRRREIEKELDKRPFNVEIASKVLKIESMNALELKQLLNQIQNEN